MPRLNSAGPGFKTPPAVPAGGQHGLRISTNDLLRAPVAREEQRLGCKDRGARRRGWRGRERVLLPACQARRVDGRSGSRRACCRHDAVRYWGGGNLRFVGGRQRRRHDMPAWLLRRPTKGWGGSGWGGGIAGRRHDSQLRLRAMIRSTRGRLPMAGG